MNLNDLPSPDYSVEDDENYGEEANALLPVDRRAPGWLSVVSDVCTGE